MSDTILAGGTVVTAEGSFRADVAVSGETIAAVGVDLPRDGAEVVDVSGARVMPGFIDGHTHMDMPFGGTVTADDWDTGTAAALAGGTTMLVDFSLQDVEGTLADAVETWQGKADGKTHIDYGLHVAITNLTEDVKQELPSLPELGVATVKIFMAYKGTPLYTADEDLFEAMQIARECGLLVLVHAENGDVIAKLQEQALARGDTEPRWHGLTRPEAVRGRGDQPGDPARRDGRRAAAGRARLLRRGARGDPPRARARAPGLRARPARSTSCSPTPTSRGRASRARSTCCSPPLRDPRNRPALWHGPADARTCTSSAPTTARSTSPAQKELGARRLHADPERRARRRGARRRCCGRTACARAGSRRTCSSRCWPPTRRRCTGWRAARACSRPGADADIVVWDPDLTITATQANRHGNVDYTPYEGMTFTGAPASVYVRGELAYRDGEVLAEPGSGRFVQRTFAQPAPGPAVR